ncbi:MAG: helix-turn-helix domain-containing protein [Planctomycetota bacterium]
MPQKPSFMNISPDEIERIKQLIGTAIKKGEDKKWSGYRLRRRAQIIYFSLKGWPARKIAKEFKTSEQTVWKWRKTYRQKGIEGIKGTNRSYKL